MTQPDHDQNVTVPPDVRRREIKWDALAAIIASLVAFLALLVAAYTAYIERYTARIQTQQVRAQVWPYLISGNNDLTQSLVVTNKGVGPAIVRSVRVSVDGKPQSDWNHVLSALQLPTHGYIRTSLNYQVLSPGEESQIIRLPEKESCQQFREATSGHVAIRICFCSTLDECWVSSNGNLIVTRSMPLQVRVVPVDRCPRLAATEVFNN